MAEKDKKKAAPPPPADDSSDSSSDSDDANFSEETLQKAEGMKIEMEQYYQNLYKSMSERTERYADILSAASRTMLTPHPLSDARSSRRSWPRRRYLRTPGRRCGASWPRRRMNSFGSVASASRAAPSSPSRSSAAARSARCVPHGGVLMGS